jgi:hypothetical protein
MSRYGNAAQTKFKLPDIKSLGLEPRIVGGIIEKYGKVFIDSAQQNIQDDTSNLSRSIGFIEKDSRYKYSAVRLIGARVYAGYKGYHAYIYEHGTVERETKAGAKRGKMPKSDYMAKSFALNKDQFLYNVERDIVKIIEMRARKAGLIVK